MRSLLNGAAILLVAAGLSLAGCSFFDFGDDGEYLSGAHGIYIADRWNARIVRMDDMAGAGWTTLFWDTASGLSVTPNGGIYLTNSTSNDIDYTNIFGTGTISHGSTGAGDHQFQSPTSIFVTAAGVIYVADPQNSRIVRMNDMTGDGWATFGSQGSGDNQFNTPWAIYVR
ncbi:MAG: NHL repeat-containing protein [Armatimonadota bacterium]